MKVGDLIKCTWQPTARSIQSGYEEMKFTIKGECGVIVEDWGGNRYEILFPKFNYLHTLSFRAFEVISENR